FDVPQIAVVNRAVVGRANRRALEDAAGGGHDAAVQKNGIVHVALAVGDVELDGSFSLRVIDALEVHIPAEVVVGILGIGIVSVENHDIPVVLGMPVVVEHEQGSAVGIDVGALVQQAGESVTAVAGGGDQAGHVSAVGRAVLVAPAVVVGETDIHAHHG